MRVWPLDLLSSELWRLPSHGRHRAVLLALLKLSQQFAAAGVADRASISGYGDSLVSVRLWAAPLLGVFAFCVGSFMYNYCSSSHSSFPDGSQASVSPRSPP